MPCSQGRDVPASGACSAPSINCLLPLINCPLHITSACSSSQQPCPPSATRVLHLHIDTSMSGGPAWLPPHLPEDPPGGRHQQDPSVTRGLSALPVSGFYRERPWFWPCQLLTTQPLLTGGQHPARPRTAAHSRPALACRNTPTSPPRVGLPARGFPSRLLLGQHSSALVPGLREWTVADPCSCLGLRPRVHTVRWWQARPPLAPAQSGDASSCHHRLLFLPEPLPVRAD